MKKTKIVFPIQTNYFCDVCGDKIESYDSRISGMYLWKYRDKPCLKKQRRIRMCTDCNKAMEMFIKRYKGESK